MENRPVPPVIDNRIVCIVNIKSVELAASISSCLAKKGLYFPLFVFPSVDAEADEAEAESEPDNFISQMIGHETAVLINNAIAKMTGCDHVVYAGLTDFQKSYLRRFDFPIIEINGVAEIDEKLAPHTPLPKEIYRCRREDLLQGLYAAVQEEKRLLIDDKADPTPKIQAKGRGGIIVTEKDEDDYAFPLIAVNYALSIDADLAVVEAVPTNRAREVATEIQAWRERKDDTLFPASLEDLFVAIDSVSFTNYLFATFFTLGLPYSLYLKNCLPCTHVHLHLRPDLFVCNAIGYETAERFHSAVVFSPKFFSDEETEMVIDTLASRNFYVRSLLGRSATSHNLGFYASFFPYDIFHICSHGGEVNGSNVTETFTDRQGQKHTVEYDEVHSFAAVPGKDLIAVTSKKFFRSFNGYKWMSPELKAQNYPDYVYKDMGQHVLGKETPNKEGLVRTKKPRIPTSCMIACVDGFHQGNLRILASHSSPIVFNNSCSSWGEIARFFLSASARGYIGTLWDIGNAEAVTAAKIFYSSISTKTIVDSLYEAMEKIRGTASENIYLYWGLHLSSMGSQGTSVEESRSNVFRELLRALLSWIKKIETTPSKEVRRNTVEIADDINRELREHFGKEDLEKLKEYFENTPKESAPEKTRGKATKTVETRIQEQEGTETETTYIERRPSDHT